MESNSNEEISDRREEEHQSSGRRGIEFIGNYNWGFLCTPRIVCGGKRDLPPFFGKDEKISLLLAAIMGLQHALAMVGGIITPPILISSSAGFSTSTQAYLVSAALIVSSLASLIQIVQFKIPFTSYVLGSGLLSVMGITFAVVPIVNQVVSVLTACTCNGISCSVNGSCNACNQQLEGECLSGEDAYGHILGTILVCCWLQVAASFCPARILRRIFPPTVTGTSIILIGVSLITTGFEYWGGGSYCATQVAETRFASNTIVLRRLVKVREPLASMVISQSWSLWRQSNTERATNVKRMILDDTWWERVEYLLSFTEPIMSMIRYTDTDHPCLGEVYDGIDSMLEKMKHVINEKEQDPEETFFKEVQTICVERWNKMTTPLHLLAFALTPKFYSDEILAMPSRVPPYRDAEVSEGCRKALAKLFPDCEMENIVTSEFADFVASNGQSASALCDKYKKDAHAWWYLNGHTSPHLQTLAIKLLSQVLTSKALCTGNGDVKLPFGHRYYVGLGFVVFCTLVLVEMFGSPFMRNSQVIIGLAVGMLVACLVHVTHCEDSCTLQSCRDICYDVLPEGVHYNSSSRAISGIPKSFYKNATVCVQQCNPVTCNKTCHQYRYVTGTKIANADWVTFLWVHTFPLKFYAPAVLPLFFALFTATMECIGDVTATVEASYLEPFGPEFEKSIQGAVLADGLNTFWAALGTMTPVTTYAQNNGVISLSRCASRRAGIACCMWLFLLGVFSKFAAILVSIPNCVLGGMTTFLFTSVVVSGIRVLNLKEGLTRRNKFISIVSLGIGLGVNLVPAWVNISGQSSYPLQGNLWPVNPRWSAGYRGFRDAIILVLSNGFSVGGLLALLLNLILPYDDVEKELPPKQLLLVRPSSIDNGN